MPGQVESAMKSHIGRPDPLVLVPYSEARGRIRTGDIGLVSDGLLGGLIRRVTDSDYSHVFMFGWFVAGPADYDVLMTAESTTPESRVVSASSQLKRWPGLIDVFRPIPDYHYRRSEEAWAFMLRASGIDYPESRLVHDWAAIRIPGLARHVPNCNVPDGQRRVCSELVHAANRVSGFPLLADNDCDVYPSHFAARPELIEYLFTPTWGE